MSDGQWGFVRQDGTITHLAVSVAAGRFPENSCFALIESKTFSKGKLLCIPVEGFFRFLIFFQYPTIVDTLSAAFLHRLGLV